MPLDLMTFAFFLIAAALLFGGLAAFTLNRMPAPRMRSSRTGRSLGPAPGLVPSRRVTVR